MNGTLILARHGESEWNALGKWTGHMDVHLSQNGFKKSEDMGLLIKDFSVDCAFTSMQVRTIETLSCMLNKCELYEVPTTHAPQLNERDYGDYTGQNKWQIEKKIGEEEFKKLRRGWDYPVPNGETLRVVYERSVPYFVSNIVPEVISGKKVLVVAHGNSLRALIKYIENVSDEEIENVEMPFDAVLVYTINNEGRMIHKEVRKVESETTFFKKD